MSPDVYSGFLVEKLRAENWGIAFTYQRVTTVQKCSNKLLLAPRPVPSVADMVYTSAILDPSHSRSSFKSYICTISQSRCAAPLNGGRVRTHIRLLFNVNRAAALGRTAGRWLCVCRHISWYFSVTARRRQRLIPATNPPPYGQNLVESVEQRIETGDEQCSPQPDDGNHQPRREELNRQQRQQVH